MSSDEDDTLSADGAGAPQARAERLASGQIFADRYEVHELLGRGGMGVVYRVHDRTLDEAVALKLLTLGTERAVERFLREVRLARKVTHPNVARTHDVGEHAGEHFFTMEYVEGAALDQVLEASERVDAARAIRIASEIASGLEAAHDAGVVHRDLKPANVLIGNDGRVVLTDFGIARAARADTRTHDTGALVGTPHYMAPEQVLGHAVDGRTDLYALGLILFEMLTGRLPFEAENPLAVAVMRLHEPPADPRSITPVADALAELVLRCLARDPSARPASARDVRTTLEELGGASARTATSNTGVQGSRLSLFAPMSPGRRAVAVLPFAYRGAVEHDYLGDGLAEELVDVLSSTRGLRVLALGATRRFSDDRDPARIGLELGADAVVDGSIQLAGDRVRVAARLVETDSGVVRWSDRFDSRFEDVFALQETMGRRIAETLRLELDAAAHRRDAPAEAIQLYLRARRKLRSDAATHSEQSVEMLERCLELAPGFLPAYPAHAMASIRSLWSEQRDQGGMRVNRARESVARAVERAPDLAETHFARAMMATQGGEFPIATQALARALEIAPTMADAHHYLSELQVEAGRVAEGKRRAELALELDPTLRMPHFVLARAAALAGDHERALEHIRATSDGAAAPTVARGMAELRHALWRGDRDEVRRLGTKLASLPGDAARQMELMHLAALGETPAAAVQAMVSGVEASVDNSRLMSLVRQLAVEVYVTCGARDMALAMLARAAEGPLIDLGWMRGCPLVVSLAESPVYAGALALVEQRAAAMWRH